MGSRLFKRAIKLTLARPKRSASGVFAFFKLAAGNAIEIEDLRMTFEIVKTLEKTANEAKISVANLSENTRNEFARKPLHIRLDAFYDDEPQLIFKGDLHWSSSKPVGPDWITEFQCGDGMRSIREARIKRTYKSGVSSKTVLKDLINNAGMKVPTSISGATELLKQFASGVTVSGQTSVEMSRLLAKHGMSWSIQNGKLQILRNNDVRPGEAIVINQESGMIGSPEFGAPKKAGGKPTLMVKTLLLPRAIPGIKISVESLAINGVFKVTRVRHSGDTHGDEWSTEMDAVKV